MIFIIWALILCTLLNFGEQYDDAVQCGFLYWQGYSIFSYSVYSRTSEIEFSWEEQFSVDLPGNVDI